MDLIVALGIAMAVMAFVVAPFFRGSGAAGSGSAPDEDGAGPLREALAEKETLYAAIQELDFDYQSGKLSAEDHGALRQRYEEQAAGLLMRIDALAERDREARSVRKRRKA